MLPLLKLCICPWTRVHLPRALQENVTHPPTLAFGEGLCNVQREKANLRDGRRNPCQPCSAVTRHRYERLALKSKGPNQSPVAKTKLFRIRHLRRENITSPGLGADMVRGGGLHQETECILCSRIPGKSETELQRSQQEEQEPLGREHGQCPFSMGQD